MNRKKIYHTGTLNTRKKIITVIMDYIWAYGPITLRDSYFF